MSLRLFTAALLFVAAMSGVVRADGGPPPGVPELDPGAISGVATLLAGAFLLAKNRLPRA